VREVVGLEPLEVALLVLMEPTLLEVVEVVEV
jgi:hypothetical protein